MNKQKKQKGIDLSITLPAIFIVGGVSLMFALFTDQATVQMNAIFDYIVDQFRWGYIWYGALITLAALYFSFSKYGKVVLGDPEEKPRYTLFEYSSILVAMGLGATIMRTGMVQWSEVAADPPFGLRAESTDAILAGNSYSMFLWSFQTFAIFVMAAPAMAYILHVRKKPKLRISEACRVLFGDSFTDGWGGRGLDILFLISILSGAAVTLGLGTPIITHNLAELFQIEVTFPLTVIITLIWVAGFTISAYAGIDKGIKRLSTLNMYVAGFFALFVLIIGPGIFILNYFTDSIRYLFSHYIDFSFYTNSLSSGESTHIESQTVFWFAYNATWAMLHGVFAAVVSKGRTVKEMILTYLLAPTLLSWIATGLLGGLSVDRLVNGGLDLFGLMSDQEAVAIIPSILSTLPLSQIVIILFVIIAAIYMVTTLDSTTYTIATYMSNRDMSHHAPSKYLRMFVSIVITVLALTLLSVGGLSPLEVLSGLMGIPIIIIQILTVIAAKKMMDQDQAWLTNVRKN